MKTTTLNSKHLTREKAEFLLKCAEESAQSSIDTDASLHWKANVAIGLIGAALAWLLATMVSHDYEGRFWGYFLACECALLFIVGCFGAKYFLTPTPYAPLGIEPKTVNDGKYVTHSSGRMIWLYAKTLQKQLDRNRGYNKETATRLRDLVCAALVSVPVSLAISLAFWLAIAAD